MLKKSCPGYQIFEINFQTGQTDGDDIGFQFKPLVGQNIYLNSFRNDTWEQEEIVPDKSFTKGAAFIIFVFIKSDGYEHRIPLENISTLSVNGDVSLSICGLINNWSSSSCSKEVIKITGVATPATSLPSIPAEVKNAVSNPTLPYVGKIPEAIKPEMAVFFQGNVPADAKNFKINFQTSQAAGADIAFQFNPRIGEKIYLNSFRNGSLEKEETVSSQPFTKGAAFIMLVVIKSDCYEVYINGVRHCTFNHR
ncbi:galectin-4-like, partial [Trichomycterus rosablanca]|uniref:galectin-4-like n=1 Tax=Trichomycterus rosablanca TaxID=2290929 RepID=UPI002F350685